MIATIPKSGGQERSVPKAVIVTTVRVEPALYEAAQKAAVKQGVSVNAWIVEAIREKAERDGK